MKKLGYKYLLQAFLLCLLGLYQARAQDPLPVAGTANATATASGGNWSSPGTWQGGSVPGANARVLIPAGSTVTVDGLITTEYKSVRIDGELKFATGVDTELRTEYLVSSMNGRLEIGTASTPIDANRTATVVFADRGGTTTSQDPERFAPGAVLMGPVEMRGAQKTSYLALAVQPSGGANSLTLKSAPIGWRPNDKLVVAGTVLGDPTSDEVVNIASVSGSMVNLTTSLVRAHQAPAQASDLEVHVANLTRNIKFTSANQSVSAKRRGHIMFMHNNGVDMRYVEMDHIGRTDKSQPLNDYSWDELQESPSYTPPRGAYTNPRGRYSVHFHRGGFDPALTPAHVEGVTVNNDPGWGYVNHSSRVNFIRNVSYDVVGGAFNTEAGDETGSFVENIALRTVNPIDPLLVTNNPNALVDIREEVQDFAWQGDAFWFHSTGVTIEGNIAAGCSGHAFIFWPEGLIENGLGMRRGTPNLHIPTQAQRDLLNGAGNNFVMECWWIPSRPFRNNTGYTISKGVVTYYVQTRFLDQNEGGKNNIVPAAYRNSLDFVIEGTTLWNIRQRGMQFHYTENVTIRNSRIVGYGSPSGAQGIDANHWHNFDDWAFIDNDFEGFNNSNAALVPTANSTNITISGGTWNNSATDILITETNKSYIPEGSSANNAPIGSLNRNMTISNVTFQNPNNNIQMAPIFSLNQEVQDGIDFADEEKDLYYFMMGDNITLNYGPFNNALLYFDEQAANFTPIFTSPPPGNFALQVAPNDPPTDVVIPNKWRDKTNQQLTTTSGSNGSSFGGEVLPGTAVSHPSIVGGKVSAVSGDPCAGVTPGTPTSLTATNNSCNSVDLSWPAENCATSYRVQRRVDNGTWSTLAGSVSGTSYTDSSPAAGSLEYRVRAQNSNGNSGNRTSSTINCTPATQFTLTSNAGVGGSVSPSGSNNYNDGTIVSVTATPDAGFQFSGWSGDASGMANPLDVTVNANKTITANFTPVPQFTLTTSAGTGGSVSPSGANNYNSGTVVAVTATPNAGYQFSGWSGDASGTTNPLNVTVDANKTITANFTLLPPSSLTAESGTVTVSTSGYTTVNLSKSYNSPVVVVTPILPSTSTAPVVSRVRNVTGSSFQLKVQNPSGATVSNVAVQYLVVEAGTYTSGADGVQMEAKTVTSSITGRKNGWTLETETYNQSYSNPVVLGQVMSANDASWSVFYASSGSRTSPPTAGALRAGKHVGEDSNTSRANETVGLIIIEAGSGSFDGISYQAGVGSDIVRGTQNSASGYNYSHSISGATGAVLSAAGMDGGDGGWPVLLGGSSVTGSTITMSFDEDQVGDTERSHTTEQVAYMVFADGGTPPVQYTLTANAGTGGSVSGGGTYNSGTVVQVTATPDAGYQFDGWSGDASGTNNPLDVTMNGNKTITASFSQIPPTQYTLTTSATAGGSVTAGGTYNAGQVVNITATPNSGFQFDGWSGDASGTTNPLSVTMDANKSITATFSAISGGGCTGAPHTDFLGAGNTTGVTATASSVDDTATPLKSINGSGLNASQQHSAEYNDGWLSIGTNNQWIQYDFGQAYPLGTTRVWNSNEGGFEDRGINNVTVKHSTDGTNFTTLGTYNWAKATGNPNYGGFTGPDMTGIDARYVRLEINTHHGDPFGVGLAEIRFNLSCAGARPAQVLSTPVDESFQISLYPNPADAEYVNVLMSGVQGEARLSLVDMTGKELISEPVKLNGHEFTHKMDLSQIASGAYIIKVVHNAGEKSIHFVKR